MSPIDQLRVPSPRVGPEQAAANRQQNARDLLSIIPGPGNVIAAEDAVSEGKEAVGAFREGRYGRAALHGGMAALSGVGAVMGFPAGRMAGNAARGAERTLYSGYGPEMEDAFGVRPSRMPAANDLRDDFAPLRPGLDPTRGAVADVTGYAKSRLNIGGETATRIDKIYGDYVAHAQALGKTPAPLATFIRQMRDQGANPTMAGGAQRYFATIKESNE